MSRVPAYRLVTDAAEAATVAASLRAVPLIGLDTETYWDAKGARQHVSLVQLAAPDSEVFVVDVLSASIEPLRALIEEPSALMAAHNARYDQAVLRDEGLSPASFIDTLTLARSALQLPSYSLAALCEHLFGLPLDKSLQKSNWRRRPLMRAQLEYAALDVQMTLLVYEELRRKLEAEGRWELAWRSALLTGGPSSQKAMRRKRPSAPQLQLTREERRTVEALKRWRTQLAHAQRVPAYMICPDRTLECLARERPETTEELKTIYGLGESKITRFGTDLLAALRAALSQD